MSLAREQKDSASGWAPFRICVVVDLEPGQEYALRGPNKVSCRRVTQRTLPRLVTQLSPAFRLETRDPLDGSALHVDLRVSDMGDLGLEGLLKSEALLPYVDILSTDAQSQAHLRTLISRHFGARGESLQTMLRTEEARLSSPVSVENDKRLPHHDILDGLLGLVDLPTSENRTTTNQSVAVSDSVAEVRQRLVRAATTILDELLGHPELQRLSRAWRSVQTLCEAHRECDWIEIHVLSGLGQPGDYHNELERLHPDLLLLEAPVAACARDAERLASLAEWASAQGAPVVSTLGEDWFAEGVGDPKPFARRAKITKNSARWLEVIGARDSARWLLLCANDVCGAEPLTRQLGNSRDSTYAQSTDNPNHYGFLPAGVIAVKGLIVALTEGGHPLMEPSGPYGRIRSRGVWTMSYADVSFALGTRLFASEDDARDLHNLGVCCLVPTRNRDTVIPASYPMAFRPRTASGDLGAPSATLSDQLVAGRLTQLLRAAKLAYQDGDSLGAISRTLEKQLLELFPNAPPVCPEVLITETNGRIEAEIIPHRYGGMALESLGASLKLQ